MPIRYLLRVKLTPVLSSASIRCLQLPDCFLALTGIRPECPAVSLGGRDRPGKHRKQPKGGWYLVSCFRSADAWPALAVHLLRRQTRCPRERKVLRKSGHPPVRSGCSTSRRNYRVSCSTSSGGHASCHSRKEMSLRICPIVGRFISFSE